MNAGKELNKMQELQEKLLKLCKASGELECSLERQKLLTGNDKVLFNRIEEDLDNSRKAIEQNIQTTRSEINEIRVSIEAFASHYGLQINTHDEFGTSYWYCLTPMQESTL